VLSQGGVRIQVIMRRVFREEQSDIRSSLSLYPSLLLSISPAKEKKEYGLAGIFI
jgi:hypothetical protein